MAKYLMGLLFVSMNVAAQSPQPPVVQGVMDIICSTTEVVSAQIKKQGEVEVWSGVEGSIIVVTLWRNLKTKSFTLTKTNIIQDITCVIGVGAPPEEL